MTRKFFRILPIALIFTFLLSGCGSDTKTGDVTLCDYKNLSAEKKIYEISEADIEEGIESLLYDYIEYKEVSRASKTGDIVNLSLIATQGEETWLEYGEDEGYEVYLGDEEFGAEFDEKLIGVSVGDTRSFSISYEEDSDITDFAGYTISYQVKVLAVIEEIMPELTEDFVTETLGFESEEAMRDWVRQDLADTYEDSSIYDVKEDLITQVVDNSKFGDYSEELYKEARASLDAEYADTAEMFGFESLDAFYEECGMTEDDIEEEVLALMHRTIAIHAICEQENLTQKEEEYEDKALDFLLEHATITEVPATAEEGL